MSVAPHERVLRGWCPAAARPGPALRVASLRVASLRASLRVASLRASLRVAASVVVVGTVVGTAACGGIADMSDAGETASFTVETPSLGVQTFEVDEAEVRCSAIPNGSGVGDAPLSLLDVGLGDDAALLRLVVSPYEEDVVAHASNRAAGCETASHLCCAGGPCVDVTLVVPDAVGVEGGDPCWVDVAYSSGWARGTFDCTFWSQTTREPGTRVHGSFRCAIEEWAAEGG